MEDGELDIALRARKRLNAKIAKASDYVIKAEKGLNAAISVFRKTHDVAVKNRKLVPTSKHTKLVNGVTKAREKLTRKLRELRDVEEEWKEYFRPV